MTEGPKLIYEVLPKILGEVGHIAKEKRNQQQGYNYRGIEDVYAAIQPLFAKYEVFPTCEVVKHQTLERESKHGGALFFSVVHLRYKLYAKDGSFVTTEAIGEGMDSSDKSANKSLSAAYKYAFFQMFCIPTEAVDSETEAHDVAPKRTDVKFDPGPQRGPVSVPQIEAQQKQSQRELLDTKPTYEPPRQEQKQYTDEKPACPECGENKAVRFVAKSKREPGEPICYCWKKEGGCGAKFDPPNTRNDDPNEGSQVPPPRSQEALDSFDAWARILITAPVGAEKAAINTIIKAYQDKRLTSEYVFQIIERALAIAMTPQQVESIEGMIVPLRDACKIPEQGKYGWLNFGELVPVAYDRTESGRPGF